MATGDITSVAVRSDGWSADITVSGFTTGATYAFGLASDNTPGANTPYFDVVSEGYDSAGSLGTKSRRVYCVPNTVNSSCARKVYSNQTVSDETGGGDLTFRVALSDYIYVDDNTGGGKSGTAPTFTAPAAFVTNTGGASQTSNAATAMAVTNNSTVAYPKCIGHFVVEQRRPVNGTHDIEVFVVHKYAEQGKPVALVEVTATGGTSGHTESGSATAMTLSARGDLKPVYVVSLNLSTGAGFTRGELVSIKFKAYPWVGDASSTLDSNADAGTQIFQLGDLKWTIMSPVYACVDGVGASPAVSTSSATAETTPYSSIANALAGIKAYNNSTYSLNRADGGVVLLNAGSYSTPTGSTLTNGYVTLQPASSTNRAGVVFNNTSASYQPTYCRLYNVTITRPGNGYMVYAHNGDVLVLESVDFNDTHTSWYSGDTNTNVEYLDCTSNNGYFCVYANDHHSRLMRSHAYTATTESSSQPAGSTSCIFGFNTTSGGTKGMWRALSSSGYNNIVVAFCKFYNFSDGGWCYQTSAALTNVAAIGNIVERIGASATPLMEWSDETMYNIIGFHNTFAGQRFNHENDIVAGYVNKTFTDWAWRFNSFNARGNHRADIRDTDASMIGTWSVDNSVGWFGNHNEAIAYAGDQDFWGLNSNTPSGRSGFPATEVAGYTNDKSRGGSDTGNGDYTPAVGSALRNKVPSGYAVLPYDVLGTAIPNNGTGCAGAIQPAPSIHAPFFFREQIARCSNF